jgi:endonuclease/exonuclease/phosphatase family metal-dependent hydrolase
LALSKEIFIHQTDNQNPADFSLLRLLRIVQLPGFQVLNNLTKKILAVSEPAGRVFINPYPNLPENQKQVSLKILSLNLWHDWPRQRQRLRRLEAIAQIIESEDIDVAMFQEVTRTPDLDTDEWLAERLGMAHVYSRANGNSQGIGFEEGLAIYSRFSLSNPRIIDLGSTTAPITRRLALGATVHSPWGEVSVFSVHLSLFRKQNKIQLDRLIQWVQEIGGTRPALIGGDFNAPERTPQIVLAQGVWFDLYRYLHPREDATTHTLLCPLNGRVLRSSRLDYIFFKPDSRHWQVSEVRHLDTSRHRNSDHNAVMARLRIISDLTP